MKGIWLSTDEAKDVAGSIRHAIRTRGFVDEDPQAWKWLLLALHSALQGSCIAHLTTTSAPIGALTEKSTAEWLEFLENGRFDSSLRPPETRVLALPQLLKKVRKPHSAGDRSNEVGVRITDQEYEWLRHLHDEIRNQFSHFQPMGWSVEVSGIPKMAKLVSRIVLEILDIGWAFRHLEEEHRSEFRKDLTTLSASD